MKHLESSPNHRDHHHCEHPSRRLGVILPTRQDQRRARIGLGWFASGLIVAAEGGRISGS